MALTLTHAELVRLNALDRAISLAPAVIRTSPPALKPVLDLAEQIEKWLVAAKETVQ